MAVNEAQILKELEAKGVGKDPRDFYTNFITELADDIVRSYKEVIDKSTKSDSGTLKQSITVIPSKTGFEIEADYYFRFIDEGVSGVGGERLIRPLVQNSPYRFKNYRVPSRMAKSIREWSGASIEQSYAIGVSIKKHGIKPQNISDQAVTDEVLERISEDLATIMGLTVEVMFSKNLDGIQ